MSISGPDARSRHAAEPPDGTGGDGRARPAARRALLEPGDGRRQRDRLPRVPQRAHVGSTNATTWTNAAVSDSTTYTYTVRALDAAGNLGDASEPVTVTTPDVTPPSTPTALAATAQANPTRVELTWTPSTDNVGVAAYEISRDGVVLATTSATTYVDGTAAGGTTHSYTVVALDAAGNRSAPATASVSVPDTVAPSAPPWLKGVGKTYPRRIELNWAPSADDVGVVSYRIFRYGVQIGTTNGTTFTDTAIAALKWYRYDVQAVDAAGNVGPATYVRVQSTR